MLKPAVKQESKEDKEKMKKLVEEVMNRTQSKTPNPIFQMSTPSQHYGPKRTGITTIKKGLFGK